MYSLKKDFERIIYMESDTLHIYGNTKVVKPSSKYSRFNDLTEHNFQTGDILLFHNSKSCFFKLVECCTHSKYSHVAMIIKDPDFTTPPLKGLYIIESGTEPFKDSENHRKKFGVQIVPLQLVLATYQGSVYWRRLKLNIARDMKFERTLAIAHNYVHNLPYDIDPMDWLNAAFGTCEPASKTGSTKSKRNRFFCCCRPAPHQQRTNMFWCSALIAFIYSMIGLLPESTPWSYIKPVDWGTEHPTPLNFVQCSLDDEIKIL